MSVRRGRIFIDLGGVWIYGRGEHVASLGDRLGFGSTGKQAVVADAVSAALMSTHVRDCPKRPSICLPNQSFIVYHSPPQCVGSHALWMG